MVLLLEFPRCSCCGTQEGPIFPCEFCGELVCNSCTTYLSTITNTCKHEPYKPIPNTGWK